MDFDSAIATMNTLLAKKQPRTFNRAWVRMNTPCVYRFVQKEIRIKSGGIDWDRITRALQPQYQRRWTGSLRKIGKPYRDQDEVDAVLLRYRNKLYTFVSSQNREDEHVRDIISIELVRIAQRGNVSAKREIIKLVSFTIDDWIERTPNLSTWREYTPLIQTRLECCIRCYRYSGSFMRYVFKTLEYAARGLKPLIAYSLDDATYLK